MVASILQSNSRSHAEKIHSCSQLLESFPTSYPAFMDFTSYLIESMKRGKKPIGSESLMINKMLDSHLKTFPGIWMQAFQYYLNAGELSEARKLMDRSFEAVSARQSHAICEHVMSSYPSTLPETRDIILHLRQRALHVDMRNAQFIFERLVERKETDRAFSMLLVFGKYVKSNPCAFLNGEKTGTITLSRLEFFLKDQKLRLKDDIARLMDVYRTVFAYITISASFDERNRFLLGEIASCEFKVYPLLCTQYADFLRTYSLSDPKRTKILYENFLDNFSFHQANAILQQNPENVSFHLSKLQQLFKMSSLSEDDFLRSLHLTHNRIGCETIWIRLAFWKELKGDFDGAKAVFLTSLFELRFIPLDRYSHLCLTYGQFLLRRSDRKGLVVFLRKLTATNCTPEQRIDHSAPNQKKTWLCPRIWDFYIKVCSDVSADAAVVIVFERMIQLCLDTEDTHLSYIQFIKSRMKDFQGKLLQVHRKSIQRYPASLSLWWKYFSFLAQEKAYATLYEEALGNFVNLFFQSVHSGNISSTHDRMARICTIHIEAIITETSVENLKYLRDIFATAAQHSSVSSTINHLIVLRFQTLSCAVDPETKSPQAEINLSDILREAMQKMGMDFMQEVSSTLKNDILWMMNSLQTTERPHLDQSMRILLNTLIELTTVEVGLLSQSFEIKCARDAFLSSSKAILEMPNHGEIARFWIDWIAFEKRFGSSADMMALFEACGRIPLLSG